MEQLMDELIALAMQRSRVLGGTSGVREELVEGSSVDCPARFDPALALEVAHGGRGLRTKEPVFSERRLDACRVERALDLPHVLAAVAALKYTVLGDLPLVDAAEVHQLAETGRTARLIR